MREERREFDCTRYETNIDPVVTNVRMKLINGGRKFKLVLLLFRGVRGDSGLILLFNVRILDEMNRSSNILWS